MQIQMKLPNNQFLLPLTLSNREQALLPKASREIFTITVSRMTEQGSKA